MVILEDPREGIAGKLAALVAVEDFRRTVACQSLLERLAAEFAVEGVCKTPRKDRREYQSITATRYMKPLAIGI